MWYVQLDGEDTDEVLVPDSREALDLSLDLFEFLPSCREISTSLGEDERDGRVPWLEE